MSHKLFQSHIQLANGQTIQLETGTIAQLAESSVVVRNGKAMLLATVTSKQESDRPDFLPLYVEYREQFAGAGKIPGGFFKREQRPTPEEILIARIVDRTIRPCFPEGYRKSIQINLVLLSHDSEVAADSLAALGASAALQLSSLPFKGPIATVTVGKVDGAFVVNPSSAMLANSSLHITVGASNEKLLMIEGAMKEAKRDEILAAIKEGHAVIKQLCQLQDELRQSHPVTKEAFVWEEDKAYRTQLEELFYPACQKIVSQQLPTKKERSAAFKAFLTDYIEAEQEKNPELDSSFIGEVFQAVKKRAVRAHLFATGKRLDGRKSDEIRPITINTDYIPGAHGSSVFTRGETQALSTVTLGSKFDEQIIDTPTQKGYRKFMLHYNFPGFSTGEVKPQRGQSRREIGHGNLAQRAIEGLLPSGSDNPYTIRVNTDILACNGSSSMATVCSASLALFDAGIKLKQPIAGIAIGLVSGEQDVILSDILGEEDGLGDMDLKITGTKEGITACQMDIKIEKLSYSLLEEAFKRAEKGLEEILEKMSHALPEARSELKTHAPRSIQTSIPSKLIGSLIGPGGKVIQKIQEESQATLNISDDGILHIFAPNQRSLDKAHEAVKLVTAIPKIGDVFNGKVKTIREFGLFVEILPNKTGLLHISQISHEKIDDLESLFKIGDEVTVKVVAEKEPGKYTLSRKVLL